tara:strand:+ start:848 stop:1594 length:747 start_codon:yes stop_codon:yes gene_type:complete
MSSNKFLNLNFEDFKKLSKDDNLSIYEKIGFPDSYRKEKEVSIFNDIKSKATNLKLQNKLVLDIGPGCSNLPRLIIDECKRNSSKIFLIDSDEMLSHLPNDNHIFKIGACYPNCDNFLRDYEKKIDLIICYSVFHYIYPDVAIEKFLESTLPLLTPGGQLFIGDIPSYNKRKRFFSSDAGIKFHQNFMGTDEPMKISDDEIESKQIDDKILLSIISIARKKGFDAYLLPQDSKLPMENRREDIFIVRP